MNIIEKLRKYHGADGYVRDDNYEAITSIIDAWKPEGYTVEEVYNEYEAGGRWSNYKTHVYKVEYKGEGAYFELCEEVPATEMQEGGTFTFGFYEVVPQEVTAIQYVAKEGGQ